MKFFNRTKKTTTTSTITTVYLLDEYKTIKKIKEFENSVRAEEYVRTQVACGYPANRIIIK